MKRDLLANIIEVCRHCEMFSLQTFNDLLSVDIKRFHLTEIESEKTLEESLFKVNGKCGFRHSVHECTHTMYFTNPFIDSIQTCL